MKANWTIWKKLAIALSGILLLWVVAPRHDCFCGEMHSSPPGDSSAHDCCMAESNHQDECQADSRVVIQKKSCCCSSERVLYGEVRVGKTIPSNGSLNTRLAALVHGLFVDNGESRLLRQNELHNDELKPSKIFLLKRAWLD